MAISAVEDVLHVSIYPLIESMGSDTGISDGVAKRSAANILGDIFCLHQFNKNPLKYVHTNSKYGLIFAIPAAGTQ